ncbi:MAG: radical SAM protein [Nanoarchaeota archaeon]|nr:radical SAM protein [Nanoarchaeota archaeon]
MNNLYQLKYDQKKWSEDIPSPVNTLQFFITNKCNLRCKGCFYIHKLGNQEISLGKYEEYIQEYKDKVKKIIILGGEPTFHKSLKNMIKINRDFGLKTTIYTNGYNLDVFKGILFKDLDIRIGVYGSYSSEKPLITIKNTNIPVTIVYMLRRNNIHELMQTAELAEKKFNCSGFYISSIRDIALSGDYWKDTEDTIDMHDYYLIVQNFIDYYNGNIKKIHIATRGVIFTDINKPSISKCRFGNIFPDNEKIICPLDISKYILNKNLEFGTRECNKNGCVLNKIVLKKL